MYDVTIDAICPECRSVMKFSDAWVEAGDLVVITVRCPACRYVDTVHATPEIEACAVCGVAPAFNNGLCKGCQVALLARNLDKSIEWAEGYLSWGHGEENPYGWMTAEWHEWTAGFQQMLEDEEIPF
jgi:hypothetical protein